MNRSNLGETLSREGTSRRLLETNFDETPQHTRSASYSSLGLQVTAENGKLIKGLTLWMMLRMTLTISRTQMGDFLWEI